MAVLFSAPAIAAAFTLFMICELGLSGEITVTNKVEEGVVVRPVCNRVTTKRSKDLDAAKKNGLAYDQTVVVEFPGPLPPSCRAFWHTMDRSHNFWLSGGTRDANLCVNKCWLEVRSDGLYGKNVSSDWQSLYVYPKAESIE